LFIKAGKLSVLPHFQYEYKLGVAVPPVGIGYRIYIKEGKEILKR
jgi:hypothetical protein